MRRCALVPACRSAAIVRSPPRSAGALSATLARTPRLHALTKFPVRWGLGLLGAGLGGLVWRVISNQRNELKSCTMKLQQNNPIEYKSQKYCTSFCWGRAAAEQVWHSNRGNLKRRAGTDPQPFERRRTDRDKTTPSPYN